MRAVAARAEVSVKTVEAAFGTKANLLKEVIDVSVAGDDEPVAIADRAVVAEMRAEPDPVRLIRLQAVFVGDVSRRLAVIARVLDEASATAPDLADLLRTSLENRHAGARQYLEVLAARTELRVDLEEAVDIAWLLFDPHQYRMLTAVRGWSHEAYVAWLADAQERLFLA